VAHDTKRLQSLREKGEKTQAGIDERSRKAREKASKEGYALASDTIGKIWGGPSVRGPRAMTEEQLQVECKAHSLPESGRGSMERAVLRLTSTNVTNVNAGGLHELHVEVGDTHAFCRGGSHQMTLPSAGGPVLITASVNGVRTDCFLSTTSSFTLLSTDFAERAGIPSSSLTSDAFRCNEVPLNKTRRLRGVRVRLSGVEIPIRTAIAAQGLSRDVQFGMDFFAQAVHAQIDVFVQDHWLVRMLPAYGSNHCRIDVKPPRDAREELRFHAEGGSIAVLPLRHEDRKHTRDAYSSTVHIAPNKRMDTCAICGELWPGMGLWLLGRRHPCDVHPGHSQCVPFSPPAASRPRRAAIGGYHAARTGASGAARPSSRAFLQRKITWVLHVHSTDIKCEPARLAPEPRGAPRSTTLCSRLPRASRVIRAATAAPSAPG
jgi:hypothetical protein